MSFEKTDEGVDEKRTVLDKGQAGRVWLEVWPFHPFDGYSEGWDRWIRGPFQCSGWQFERLGFPKHVGDGTRGRGGAS